MPYTQEIFNTVKLEHHHELNKPLLQVEKNEIQEDADLIKKHVDKVGNDLFKQAKLAAEEGKHECSCDRYLELTRVFPESEDHNNFFATEDYADLVVEKLFDERRINAKYKIETNFVNFGLITPTYRDTYTFTMSWEDNDLPEVKYSEEDLKNAYSLMENNPSFDDVDHVLKVAYGCKDETLIKNTEQFLLEKLKTLRKGDDVTAIADLVDIHHLPNLGVACLNFRIGALRKSLNEQTCGTTHE